MQDKTRGEIIRLVKRLIPNHGEKMVLQGRTYPEAYGLLLYWFVDGERQDYALGEDFPSEVDAIMQLMRTELSYEHFLITAYENGKVDIETRYIPEEDKWPGLHMRRVSELEEHEIGDPVYIPREDWLEMKALAEMPDNERISILLADEMGSYLDGKGAVTVVVECYDEGNPQVSLSINDKHGDREKDLHEDSINWLIKQTTELRNSAPYNKSPWEKMTAILNEDNQLKMDFEYAD